MPETTMQMLRIAALTVLLLSFPISPVLAEQDVERLKIGLPSAEAAPAAGPTWEF
jgi:hypothetical protein